MHALFAPLLSELFELRLFSVVQDPIAVGVKFLHHALIHRSALSTTTAATVPIYHSIATTGATEATGTALTTEATGSALPTEATRTSLSARSTATAETTTALSGSAASAETATALSTESAAGTALTTGSTKAARWTTALSCSFLQPLLQLTFLLVAKNAVAVGIKFLLQAFAHAAALPATTKLPPAKLPASRAAAIAESRSAIFTHRRL